MQTRKAADNITDLGPTVKIGRISLRLFVSVLLNRQSLRIMGWADARNSKEKKCRYICLSLNCKYRKIVIKIFNICSRRICIFISPDNPHILIDISSLGIWFLFIYFHNTFLHTPPKVTSAICVFNYPVNMVLRVEKDSFFFIEITPNRTPRSLERNMHTVRSKSRCVVTSSNQRVVVLHLDHNMRHVKKFTKSFHTTEGVQSMANASQSA